jgi:hypothetical protein
LGRYRAARRGIRGARALDDLALKEGTVGSPPRVSRDRQRIEEIEALLRDPNGDGQRRYWTDAGLRTDYAQALARLHGDRGSLEGEGAASSAAAPSDAGMAPATA